MPWKNVHCIERIAYMFCAPNEVRTRVSALSPLHGDERAGEIKTRLKQRVCAPDEVRARISALGPLHGDERAEEIKTCLK